MTKTTVNQRAENCDGGKQYTLQCARASICVYVYVSEYMCRHRVPGGQADWR